MRYPTPVFNPLLKAVHDRKNASFLFPGFPLVFETSRARRILLRAQIEGELSAKQMPLSDPRETEEMVYPAMPSVLPIGFQGKSDAQLQALHCSELVISLWDG